MGVARVGDAIEDEDGGEGEGEVRAIIDTTSRSGRERRKGVEEKAVREDEVEGRDKVKGVGWTSGEGAKSSSNGGSTPG